VQANRINQHLLLTQQLMMAQRKEVLSPFAEEKIGDKSTMMEDSFLKSYINLMP
jgi:hypothetical protein